MDNHPLVSIITTTYNHQQYIGRCIDSVLKQTYPHWEMIIVDDGSADGTGRVVEQYTDPRIKYFYQENKGIWRLKENYNFALERAIGRYIGILEGDDVWEADKLEKQVPLMLEHGPAVLFGRYYRIGPDGERKSSPKVLSRKVKQIDSSTVLRRFIGGVDGGLTAFPVTVLIDGDLLRQKGGFQQPDYYPAVEHPTWLHLARYGSFLDVDDVFGSWRTHGTQATGTLGIELSHGVAQCNLDLFDFLDESEIRKLDLRRCDVIAFGDHQAAASYFSMGRYGLIRKNWKEARAFFLKGLLNGSWVTRMKSVCGILFSYLHRDLEILCGIKNNA